MCCCFCRVEISSVISEIMFSVIIIVLISCSVCLVVFSDCYSCCSVMLGRIVSIVLFGYLLILCCIENVVMCEFKFSMKVVMLVGVRFR